MWMPKELNDFMNRESDELLSHTNYTHTHTHSYYVCNIQCTIRMCFRFFSLYDSFVSSYDSLVYMIHLVVHVICWFI